MQITHCPERSSPWKVDIPASVSGHRRTRKFFKTKPEAITFVSKLKREGAGALQEASPVLTVADAVDSWVARSHDKSTAYQRQLRLITGHLCAEFGRKDLASVDHRQLEAWLLGLPGGETYRINHYRVTRRFFEWCVDWLEAIPRNPMKKVGRPADIEGREVAILQPEDMGKVLAVAAGRLLAWVALGGFAGLRSEEILRLDWADVDWKAGEIFVRQPKRAKGWRPRYVKILPALRRVLGTECQTGKVFPGGMRELYMQRRAAMDALGWQRWPQNCLRHSFGTYHLAMWKDASKTAHEMGHSNPEITHRHYAIAAKGADAKAWWKLGLE
jgi:integrase